MYTIERIVELTEYSKNTIYTHSVGLSIRPIRGKIAGNNGKGLYTREDLDKLLFYKELVANGEGKEEAYSKVKEEYGE